MPLFPKWRALKALVHDAVDRTTDLVEEGHESTSRTVMKVLTAIEPLAEPATAVDDVRRLATGGVLGTIRVVNRLVETITDASLDLVERVLPSDEVTHPEEAVAMRSDAMREARWVADAALGLVNGAVGDYLHARENALDLGMRLRHGDAYLDLDAASLREALPEASGKIAIFVHGLMATEWSWCLDSAAYHGDAGTSFATLLTRDLGYTSFFLRYNTGCHISTNGKLFAESLEKLVARYPVPVEEIVLIGHSMGGLVVRSACHYGDTHALSWVAHVKRVFCLGSPHHGAPLEKLGHVAAAVLASIDTPGTRIPARILEGRSAGIKDLRHGSLVDEDWLDHDPDALRSDDAARDIPLLDHVAYHFLAATITTDPEHPLGRVMGDLLVRTPSARAERLVHRVFPIDTKHFGNVKHHQIQNHPAVYEQIRKACAGEV